MTSAHRPLRLADHDVLALTDADSRSAAVVYFAQAESGGPIKIGVSSHAGVKARIASLQTGNPSLLVIRRLVVGGNDLETALHARYASQRLLGEWFRPDGELVDVARARAWTPETEAGDAWETGYKQGLKDALDESHEAIREVEAAAEAISARIYAAWDRATFPAQHRGEIRPVFERLAA